MTFASSLKFHDYQYAWQVAQGTWKWTVRMDVSGPSPTFQVRDIVSPYGLLRDSIPLPGDIVAKMAASIDELGQLFSPRMLLSATSFTITTDEGRGFSAAEAATLTNSGSYGSILNASLTSSAAYLKVAPANLSGLASGVTGNFGISVDSTPLLAASSPYSGTITVQDPNATNNPQTITVSMVVRPKATVHPTPDDLAFTATGPVGGPWLPVPSMTFQVVNTGPSGSVLDYQIQKLTNNSPWLTSFTPSYGTLASNVSQTITVSVVPVPNTAPGTYTEYLRVSGYSTNQYADVLITLTIV